jgi:hypothetical protein
VSYLYWKKHARHTYINVQLVEVKVFIFKNQSIDQDEWHKNKFKTSKHINFICIVILKILQKPLNKSILTKKNIWTRRNKMAKIFTICH